MTIFKRQLKSGYKWRAVVRIKGYPTVCETFDRKQEAIDWKRDTLQKVKLGKFKFGRQEHKKTFIELVERYIKEGVIGHHKAAKDTLRHLEYFKERIGNYALVFITPDLLLSERKVLEDTPTYRGEERNPATVNRYMSSISGAMRYACKNLRWMDDNPCANLIKLKEHPKKKTVLTPEEEIRVLKSCKESKASYLYCMVLLDLTTGMRKGEVLALEWTDIDFDYNFALIRDSKNGRPRRVSLVDSVMTELKKLYANRNPEKPLVFASKRTFNAVYPEKAFAKALERAEVFNFQFHSIRHHFATFGGQIGASDNQLMSQCGWTTSAMPAHYSLKEARETRFIGEALESRIQKGMGNE
ncbi:MAG: site-specific integrase [Waddliaceae bacterium]